MVKLELEGEYLKNSQRKISSVLIFFLGLVVSYFIYSYNTSGNLQNTDLFFKLFILALSCFMVSLTIRRKAASIITYFICSFLLSCLLYVTLFVIFAFCKNDLTTMILFSPLIFLFVLPLIVASVVSAYLIMQNTEKH